MDQKTIKKDATRKQIRGSSLLLFGKFISVGLNFAAQVILVRYLSKSDYGIWGIALAAVAFFETFSTFGLKRSVSRFIPIYHENEEYEKVFGTIFLVLGTILFIGIVIICAVQISPGFISHLIDSEGLESFDLLLIMIFLVPVEAMDGTLVGLFACFAKPRVIVYQKHLFGPSLKLIVVLLLIIFQSNVLLLGYGYVTASLLGVIIYCIVFIRLLRKLDLLKHFNLRRLNIPAREIFAFTIPLLTSDLVNVIMHSTDTLILGIYHGATEVANYRVVFQAAHFNKLVMISFAFLYTPLAARLFAKNNYEGINELYWRTAIWMGILTFPVFALTFSMAKPLIVFAYGVRYEQSWIFLLLLSFGYYFNIVLGFNGLTLKVLGKIRYVVIVNITAVLVCLVGCLLLIPKYGALGATMATSGSMILHNILKQAGLRLTAGIRIFDWQYLSYYLIITFCAFGLFLVQILAVNNFFIGIVLVGLVSLFVFKLCEKKLKIEETFPELLNIPLIKLLFRTSNK